MACIARTVNPVAAELRLVTAIDAHLWYDHTIHPLRRCFLHTAQTTQSHGQQSEEGLIMKNYQIWRTCLWLFPFQPSSDADLYHAWMTK